MSRLGWYDKNALLRFICIKRKDTKEEQKSRSTRNSNERAKKISLSPAASKSLSSYWGY